MEKEHVNQFIAMHGNKFTQEVLPSVKRKVESVPDERFDELCAIDFKSPTTMLIIAILLGPLAVDRFMLGEIGMGILKLFTLGLCGILEIIDIFSAQKRTSEYNLRKLDMAL